MTDYQIQASTRRCFLSGQDIRPGETYYSVLLDEGDTLVRRDYSEQAWQGPPNGAFSFWKTKLPTSQTTRRPPIDDELLMECFQRLEPETDPGKLGFRFVLALLLMRRRRLRLDVTRQEGGHEVLVLRGTGKSERFEVLDPGLSDQELEAVQEDVFRVLGWE